MDFWELEHCGNNECIIQAHGRKYRLLSGSMTRRISGVEVREGLGVGAGGRGRRVG